MAQSFVDEGIKGSEGDVKVFIREVHIYKSCPNNYGCWLICGSHE